MAHIVSISESVSFDMFPMFSFFFVFSHVLLTILSVGMPTPYPLSALPHKCLNMYT